MPYQKKPEICPVCTEKTDFNFIQDHQNEKGKWSLYQCLKCQAQFWLPFENPGPMHYERSYIVRESTGPQFLYGYHKKFLKLVKNIPVGSKILDIGFGTGDLLAELAKRRCNVWGMDIDKNGVEFAQNYFGLKNLYALSDKDFFNLPNLPKFDMITFFELIEHLDNPLEFIQRVSGALKEEGKVVVSSPSRERVLPNLLECDFPPHHLIRWNKESMENLFSKAGLEVEKVYYTDQLKFLLDSLNHKLRTGLVLKIAKGSKNKEFSDQGEGVVGGTIFTRFFHRLAYLKDYLIGGPLAMFLLPVSEILGYKNGDMIIFFKKAKKTAESFQSKVTVVLPTYKRPRFLERAILSVLNQDYKNFELIVIDDSPDDESKKVVFQFSDPRLRYIKNEKKTSLPAARNKGIKESTPDSKYVAFLDDDNEFLPQFLAKTIGKLENRPDLAGTIPNAKHLFDDGTKIRESVEVGEKWDSGFGNGGVFRKDIFAKDDLWFDEKIKGYEDWDFGLRILKRYKVEALPEPLQLYHHHPAFSGSTLSTIPLSIETLDYFFEKHFSYCKSLGSKSLAVFYFRLGKLYCRSGHIGKGKQFFKKAFFAHPELGHLKYYLFWSFPRLAQNFYLENIQHKILKIYGKFR